MCDLSINYGFLRLGIHFQMGFVAAEWFLSNNNATNFYQVALVLFETEVHTISDQMMMPLLITHQMNIEHNGSLSTLHIYSVH